MSISLQSVHKSRRALLQGMPLAALLMGSACTWGRRREDAVNALQRAAPVQASRSQEVAPVLQEYAVPRGSHPHDVASAPDGTVWYTAQRSGELGRLDPAGGQTRHIPLGVGSAPHGVIVGPDGAPRITDGGLNALVRLPARE